MSVSREAFDAPWDEIPLLPYPRAAFSVLVFRQPTPSPSAMQDHQDQSDFGHWHDDPMALCLLASVRPAGWPGFFPARGRTPGDQCGEPGCQPAKTSAIPVWAWELVSSENLPASCACSNMARWQRLCRPSLRGKSDGPPKSFGNVLMDLPEQRMQCHLEEL
ncbi:hypothetical protein BN1723_003203 [Verticillium longisporum]|uniref:Uncharacterized protein n=1 Tax=Verticillium longisporum TaxID=100787 RepID=A0A0G4LRR0_VERLO|nr:hypothetical protein BN1723_003203 [Verticillium longisporum]